MCVKTGALWGVGTIILLLVFQTPFTSIFTNNEDIRQVIVSAYPVILIYVFFDCI